MSIRFNVTGSRRKALVGAISEILACVSTYSGAPTFVYTVGNYIIDKNGVVTCADEENPEETIRLMAGLKQRGFEESVDALETASLEDASWEAQSAASV